MEAAASAASDREDQLRGEIRRAETRMQAAELAASEATSQTGDSTKPLLRQIEAMAAAAVRLEALQSHSNRTINSNDPAHHSPGLPADLCVSLPRRFMRATLPH